MKLCDRCFGELFNISFDHDNLIIECYACKKKGKLKLSNEKDSRIIPRDKRYDILKRQKWRCNYCNEILKFNSKSNWEGKVAHIDHIHPYTERYTYSNGRDNINELSNLQALCPDCNLKKGKKGVN